MKETSNYVGLYLQVSATNFSDAGHMTSVLEKLCHTFHVFKTHEQIENRFIMRRLKEKLIALDITDAAVCNCHSDNRLTEMISMVLDGYRWAQHSESERIKYGQRLRHALEDFTQIFLPHMKEEEEVSVLVDVLETVCKTRRHYLEEFFRDMR